MSKFLSTLDGKVTIKSCADWEGFGLSVLHEEKGKIDYKEFSWHEYGILLRQAWEEYITKGQKPELAGHTLSDDGLVTETLHYIAPNSFTHPAGPTLPSDQESFIYWLKSQSPRISQIINEQAFDFLDSELDVILRMNLERKDK
ncbi:MAG: hypothetical protein KAT43_04820 [Nanoarchaeota archaeon]|nr:hypothetical protein [Nanoarchaeota archaeon]